MEHQQEALRTHIYLMIAALYRQCPTRELLTFLAELETEQQQSEMQYAWLELKQAAQHCLRQEQLGELQDEYQELFIGIGRGEVVPFASWHITGSLMEKPLAHVRQDLKRLGFEREENVKEPEDHISALCEVMAQLTTELEAVQQAFFNRHISTWFESLTEQIAQAKNAHFYKAVAKLTQSFLTLERVRFSENKNYNKTHIKVDVKNITEYE